MSGDHNHSPLPKFGMLTSPTESVPDEVERFHKLGFDFVEIGIEEPAATPRILVDQKDRILSAISANDLFAIGHTAYWVGFGSSHEKVRNGWIEEGKDMIHTASELRLGLLNFHFNSRFGSVGTTEESRNTFLRNFIGSMEELTRFAATQNVELMLENVPPENGHPLESIHYFSEVMEAVPSLKFHLDVAHAFIENRMKGVKEYIGTFSDRLAHVHLHDNHGEQDEHLPLGMGRIDLRKVVRFLGEVDYDRTVTFEVFTSRADAVHSRELFKKQWKKIRR
jgi:sugar phosphate isomerase/epimerase